MVTKYLKGLLLATTLLTSTHTQIQSISRRPQGQWFWI